MKYGGKGYSASEDGEAFYMKKPVKKGAGNSSRKTGTEKAGYNPGCDTSGGYPFKSKGGASNDIVSKN